MLAMACRFYSSAALSVLWLVAQLDGPPVGLGRAEESALASLGARRAQCARLSFDSCGSRGTVGRRRWLGSGAWLEDARPLASKGTDSVTAPLWRDPP